MSTLKRVPVTWNGTVGMPGVSFFFSSSTTDVTTSLGTFFTAIKSFFPTGLSWQVPAAGDTIDSATGALNGGWTGGTSANIAATGTGSWAAGTGCMIRWTTGQIRKGRRFQGRTFLVPLTAGQYDSSGTINDTNLATIQTAVTALVGGPGLHLWGRPLTHTSGDGFESLITAGQALDKVVSLRSRRS